MDARCRSGMLAWAAALALLAALLYLPSLGHDFVGLDDGPYVRENPVVSRGLSTAGVRWAFRLEGREGNWHPLTWLSHMLDVSLFGLRPAGHHLTNLLLHAANTALLFLFLAACSRSPAPSALVAALFAAHPLHVESVAWVAERKELLCLFFGLLALLAWLRHVRRGSAGAYAQALGWYAASLMAKPMLVTLPFLLLLLDWWPFGRARIPGLKPRPIRVAAPSPWRLVVEKTPFFLLAAASSAITYVFQLRAGAMDELARQTLAVRVANAAVSCAAYLRDTVVPRDLAVFYPHPGMPGPATLAAAVLLLAGITAVVAWRGARMPWLPFGWLWYLGTLVPVIGLVQAGGQMRADRYTYLPLVGVFVMAAWSAQSWAGARAGRRWAFSATAAAAIAACALLTTLQLRTWRDSETLFQRAIAVTSGNYLAHFNLANHLLRTGRAAESVPHYRESLSVSPGKAETWLGLGVAYSQLGRLQDEIAAYREGLRRQPSDQKLRYNLERALEDAGPGAGPPASGDPGR